MANGKSIVRIAVIMIALVGVLGFHLEAIGMTEEAPSVVARPDVIMIDTIAKLEELEQPAAVFMHDAHTKALKDQGMSCDSCHEKDAKGNMVLTFKRQADAEMTAAQLKDSYHDNCITCHVKSGDKGFKTGPMVGECRSCHQEKPAVVGERVSAAMDTALHGAHWTSKVIKAEPGQDTNCGACHAKKGEEDAWRFNPEFAAKPVNVAYHNKCVTCHETFAAKKALKTGPVECAGCHGAAEKAAVMAKLEKMEMPRLPRKQPDAALMFHGEPGKIKMVVAFDHKAHEAGADNCITCHVKGVNAPMDKSYQAMHNPAADSSCVGCHLVKQEKPECAGCHAARSIKAQPTEASCASCHTKAPKDVQAMPADASKESKEEVAKMLIAERPEGHATVAVNDIPDIVEIGTISDKYQASKMPHRKIVLKLMEGMKDSPLAARFHEQPQSMCSGCHHNSPAYATPKCSSCHAKAFETADGRPGLKAAYHQQCMDCHTKMKLEKPVATNCVACHEKKAN